MHAVLLSSEVSKPNVLKPKGLFNLTATVYEGDKMMYNLSALSGVKDLSTALQKLGVETYSLSPQTPFWIAEVVIGEMKIERVSYDKLF